LRTCDSFSAQEVSAAETRVDTHLSVGHGCQIFLGTIYKKGGKYTKWPLNNPMAIKYTKKAIKYTKLPLNYQMSIKIPKGHNIFQIDVEFTKLFNSKALRNSPKSGFLVLNCTIWQPWCWPERFSRTGAQTRILRVRQKKDEEKKVRLRFAILRLPIAQKLFLKRTGANPTIFEFTATTPAL
jgi:hypothetical protein